MTFLILITVLMGTRYRRRERRPDVLVVQVRRPSAVAISHQDVRLKCVNGDRHGRNVRIGDVTLWMADLAE